MTLGEFLKSKRESLKLSARQAAEEIGISHTELHRLEADLRKKIDRDVLDTLLKFYHIPSISSVAYKDKEGTHRIYDLLHEHEHGTHPPADALSIFAGLEAAKISPYYNIIRSTILNDDWTIDRTTKYHVLFDLCAYKKEELWGFIFIDGRRDSKKLVMETYYHLLTYTHNANHVSIVTHKPVLYNAFKNRYSVNFKFKLSIILVNIKDSSVISIFSNTI